MEQWMQFQPGKPNSSHPLKNINPYRIVRPEPHSTISNIKNFVRALEDKQVKCVINRNESTDEKERQTTKTEGKKLDCPQIIQKQE